MFRTVSDVFIETLVAAGVKRVYGVVGDSLNGLTDVIRQEQGHRVAARAARRDGGLRRRRRGAGHRAAGRVRRQLRAGKPAPDQWPVRLPSQPRARCWRSRRRFPAPRSGSGYFQETQPEHLFKECSHYCELVSQPEQMPRVLGIAMRTAIAQRGVAVVILPGDVALRKCAAPALALGLDERDQSMHAPAGTSSWQRPRRCSTPRRRWRFSAARAARARTPS